MRVAELVGDIEVSKWTSNIPHPYSQQDALDWITQAESDDSKHPFAVELDGKLVACVSYWPYGSKDLEVGYWVGKDYWGKGVGSQALRLLLSADSFPSAHDVYAKILEKNTGSRRVLEKCGFSFLKTGAIFKGEHEAKVKIYVRHTAT